MSTTRKTVVAIVNRSAGVRWEARSKPDERDAHTAKALKEGGEAGKRRPKPKRQRPVCSVCGAADAGLYRYTAPVALYCAKHVPPR